MLIMRQMNNNQRATSMSSLWRNCFAFSGVRRIIGWSLELDESRSGLPGETPSVVVASPHLMMPEAEWWGRT